MDDSHEDIELNAEELRHKINHETGRLGWPELQRHYARGVVVVVAKDLDLIEVAATIAEDNSEQFDAWASRGMIHRAQDEEAQRWEQDQTIFWSAVVAPWVLVQEITIQ